MRLIIGNWIELDFWGLRAVYLQIGKRDYWIERNGWRLEVVR